MSSIDEATICLKNLDQRIFNNNKLKVAFANKETVSIKSSDSSNMMLWNNNLDHSNYHPNKPYNSLMTSSISTYNNPNNSLSTTTNTSTNTSTNNNATTIYSNNNNNLFQPSWNTYNTELQKKKKK